MSVAIRLNGLRNAYISRFDAVRLRDPGPAGNLDAFKDGTSVDHNRDLSNLRCTRI